MTRWKIMIAALDGQAMQADSARQRLSDAWTASAGAEFTAVQELDEINARSLRDIDAVVLLADCAATPSSTLTLLNTIEEAGVPVLALLDAQPEPANVFEFAGAVVERADASPTRLCTLLEGMLHRQNEVKRLRAEIALSQRFHGGLKGQIAKMHEELQLAALVQREFLPRELPSIHNVEFATLWRPSNYVSGDIYDLIRLDEDHVGVFVADAVGHGVPAALMTMVICRSLMTKEITGNTYRLVEPAEVLGRLNTEMIRRQGSSTRFATAVYAMVNCRSRIAKVAGAGHPPPIWLSHHRPSEVIETAGGLLGVFPDESYEQVEIELGEGDRLLFYTDGFEQAFPRITTDAYESRLPTTQYRTEFDQLARLPSATDMIDVISHRLDDQSGSLHQADDLTLICMYAGAVGNVDDRPGAELRDDRSVTARETANDAPSRRGLRLTR